MKAKKKSKTAAKKSKTSSKAKSYFKCPQCRGFLKISEKKHHRCVEPSEKNLTQTLDQDLLDAWLSIKKFAEILGTEKSYPSAKAFMFSRRVCYFFLRPKKKYIELTFFLDTKLNSPSIKRILEYSKTKFAHTILIVHADQIEAPLTDWIKKAWELAD